MHFRQLGTRLNCLKDRLLRLDRVLAVALILTIAFSLNGIRWGRVEGWNRDAMALRGLGNGGAPGNYLKPPFHTFLNHALIKAPVELGEQITRVATGKKPNFNEAKLLGSRLVTMLMYLGTIILAFEVSLTFFGRFAARVSAFVLATSAGFIGFEHFLSCDSPLLFWMMLALWFAVKINREGKTRDYLLAGLVAGIATNTKYNGLAMGLALVAAHVLSDRNQTWKERLFAPNLIKGVLMVPVAIVLTNPFMVWDWHRFYNDFRYVNVVTPRYDGQAEGYGYGRFFAAYFEVLGIPGTVAVALCVLFSAIKLLRKRNLFETETVGFLLLLSVTALYVAKMGSFPRIETRFILPAVLFSVLMAGPFVKTMQPWRIALFAVAIPILIYNCVCSFYVGKRFNDDPRLDTLAWMTQNVKTGSRIESSAGSPHWRKLPGLDLAEVGTDKPKCPIPDGEAVDLRMPRVNGRAKLFKTLFKDDPWMVKQAAREGVYDETVFSREKLSERNPDIISIYSSDYDVPSDAVKKYYSSLMAGEYPYKVVYNRQSPPVPKWIYPHHIDFLTGWIVLLNRK